MSLKWIHEDGPAHWDQNKRDIIGDARTGIFSYSEHALGDIIPGDWWRVEDDGRVVGYGWMDITWGDAQILLSVRPDAQKHGVGTFILDGLEREAGRQGLNYLFNVVPAEHPDPDGIKRWLEKRKFAPSQEDRLSRRVVAKG